METLVTIIHVLLCFFLIAVVLLQSGRGSEIGAAFGGASHTVFGSSSTTNPLQKLTTGAAIIFMITSITLAWFANKEAAKGSVMTEKEVQKETSAPAPSVPPSPLEAEEAVPQPSDPGPALPEPAPTRPPTP